MRAVKIIKHVGQQTEVVLMVVYISKPKLKSKHSTKMKLKYNQSQSTRYSQIRQLSNL